MGKHILYLLPSKHPQNGRSDETKFAGKHYQNCG